MEKIRELIEIASLNLNNSPFIQKQTAIDHSKELQSEINELVDALEKNESKDIIEEIGDVLFAFLILIKICEKEFGFNINDSIKSSIVKIKRRKPHIFNNNKITLDEEKKYWNKIKEEEKK
ncbi:hypothetical protein GOV08_03110 [Candidatus Woesearchaeota archaeon]|nr:hypothetical protein [Candidatus Woesearchaeota archaeon]